MPLGGNSLSFGDRLLINVPDCAPAKQVLLVAVPWHQTCIRTCIRALDRMPDMQYLAHSYSIQVDLNEIIQPGARFPFLGHGAASYHIPCLGAFVSCCHKGFSSLYLIYFQSVGGCWRLNRYYVFESLYLRAHLCYFWHLYSRYLCFFHSRCRL